LTTSFSTLALAIAIVSTLGGCEGSAPAERPSILLISIDSLRADHLSCYGYERETSPRMDQLAQEAILFENAVSSSSWTLPAHAAAFTGLPDSVHRVERTNSRLAEGHTTLAEALSAEGYQTVGFWSGPFLDPSFGLGQGFEEYIDCRTPFELPDDDNKIRRQKVANFESHGDVTSPRLVAAVSEWMAERRRAPFLLFVHMWDVHYDFIPPPPYDTLFAPDPDYDGPADGRNVAKNLDGEVERDVEHTLALYDGEIAWTDLHVGQLIDLLDEHGIADNTIVIVTADHGEEFFEHGAFGHRKTLFEESIRIPLIMRLPDGSGAGTRETRPVSITDIAPTILEAAGVAPMGPSMGESLLATGTAERRVAVSEIFTKVDRERGPLLSLRGEGWKLVVRRRDGTPWRLFDLNNDPEEQEDLLGKPGALEAIALEELGPVLARLAELKEKYAASADENTLTDELEAELRSLGYIGDE